MVRRAGSHRGRDLPAGKPVLQHHRPRHHHCLEPRHLLICEGGDIGRTAIWKGGLDRCYYQNHLHRARLKNAGSEAQFVLYWLWYAFEIGNVYFGRGNVTTIPNLSRSKLCELPIPLPALSEQRKIAAVLGLVQRAMEQQERLIDANRRNAGTFTRSRRSSMSTMAGTVHARMWSFSSTVFRLS